MTTPPPYRPRQYLSYSTLMSFIRCPRKYFYEKTGISSKDEPAALTYGSAMHKAVPAILLGEGLDAAVAKFSSVWNPELDDSKHNLACAIRSLAHFESQRKPGRRLYDLVPPPPRPEGLTVGEEVADSEVIILVDVGLSVPMYFRVDALCRHTHTGELYGWELKTMGRMTSSMFDGLEFNPQLLSYVLALSTATDTTVRGMMFEALLKDSKKQDCIAQPVPVPQHQLEHVAKWLRYYGNLLLQCEAWHVENKEQIDVESANGFPKNFAGCTAYPMFYQPGSACEFQRLCRVQDWTSLLGDFDIKPEHRPIELMRGLT